MSENLQTRDEDRRDVLTRPFSLRAATVNDADRSVEATISTGQRVQVYDWRRGEVIEEILLPSAAQLPDQMPLLANHSRWSLDDILGSTRNLRVDGDSIVGRLFFASDADSERAWQKVRGGHITDVSIGYRVEEATEIAPGQSATVLGSLYTAGKRALRIATNWTAKEASLVPVGADKASKIRDDQTSSNKEHNMPPKLRAYLESIGLRSEATDHEAWQFLNGLQGQQRQDAQKIFADGASGQPDETRQAPPAAPPASTTTVAPESRNDPPPPDLAGYSVARLDTQVYDQAIAQRAIEAERTRTRQIRTLGGSDVPAELVARAIDEGWDEQRATTAFLEAVRARRVPDASQTPYHETARTTPLTNASVRSLAAGLLIGQGIDPVQRHCRMHDGRTESRAADELTAQDCDAGHGFRRMSAIDLVRECARIDTGRLHWDPDDAIRSATSGATLSYVFSTNVYAQLIAGWDRAGDSTVGWCDEEDVPNFLQQEDISLEAQSRLDQLPRGQEATHATASDTHETYKIARYAKQFVVDEQDVIDDRLGAIMRMPMEMGIAARQLRPDLVYSILIQNPSLVADSGAWFNATAVTTAGGHANLGTGALSSTNLKAAISAMVKQRLGRTASDPGDQLTIRPRFLIVPADLEWTARELTAAAALAKLFADSSDPFYAQLNLLSQEGLRVVVDDRIGLIGVMDPRTKTVRTGLNTNWFLTSGGTKGLRVAYRRGTNRQPQSRQFVLDKGRWGMGWDINMDIGAAPLDFRTWYKSTGAA